MPERAKKLGEGARNWLRAVSEKGALFVELGTGRANADFRFLLERGYLAADGGGAGYHRERNAVGWVVRLTDAGRAAYETGRLQTGG